MKVRIRRALASDAASVKALELAADLSPWSESDYREEAGREGSIFIVAEAEQIIGFILMRLITNSDDFCAAKTPQFHAEILNFAVHTTMRRRGLGSALLLSALAQGQNREVTRYFLEVRSSNLAAIGFYRINGFREIGVRRGFYSHPPEDAVLMECSGDKVLARVPPFGLVFDL